ISERLLKLRHFSQFALTKFSDFSERFFSAASYSIVSQISLTPVGTSGRRKPLHGSQQSRLQNGLEQFALPSALAACVSIDERLKPAWRVRADQKANGPGKGGDAASRA